MHDIEPHYRWQEYYDSAEDKSSPFYGKEYDEFRFHQKIYNYFIHPRWDFFGSPTLYTKQLFADYELGVAIFEFIGEWNDGVTNDIMYFKRDIADDLYDAGIRRFILICENVLNFHGSDDCYYEEWQEDLLSDGGWVCLLNTRDHVLDEMRATGLDRYIHMGQQYNDVIWRPHKPQHFAAAVQGLVSGRIQRLSE